VVAADTHGLRPRIRRLERNARRESTVERGLEGVVAAVPGGRQKGGLRSAPELLEVRLPVAPCTRLLAGVQIQIAGLMHLPRRDVAKARCGLRGSRCA